MTRSKWYHRHCFTCRQCSHQLDQSSVMEGPNSDIYCKTCYVREYFTGGRNKFCDPGESSMDKGRIPGLVVMEGDSCSEGCVFESHHSILDGHFSQLFVVQIVKIEIKRSSFQLFRHPMEALETFAENVKARSSKWTRLWPGTTPGSWDQLLAESSVPITINQGKGCGSVGRAVASATRGPQFESSHQQNCFLSTVLKRRKRRRGREWSILKKLSISV